MTCRKSAIIPPNATERASHIRGLIWITNMRWLRFDTRDPTTTLGVFFPIRNSTVFPGTCCRRLPTNATATGTARAAEKESEMVKPGWTSIILLDFVSTEKNQNSLTDGIHTHPRLRTPAMAVVRVLKWFLFHWKKKCIESQSSIVHISSRQALWFLFKQCFRCEQQPFSLHSTTVGRSPFVWRKKDGLSLSFANSLQGGQWQFAQVQMALKQFCLPSDGDGNGK